MLENRAKSFIVTKGVMKMEYMLEIYEPGSVEDLWVHFKTSSPFMAINVGDLINPGIWEGSQSPMKILRVVNLEHIIWEINSVVKHKLMVFTEEIEGSAKARLG